MSNVQTRCRALKKFRKEGQFQVLCVVVCATLGHWTIDEGKNLRFREFASRLRIRWPFFPVVKWYTTAHQCNTNGTGSPLHCVCAGPPSILWLWDFF